jgi:hypothetical protein
VIDEGGAPPGRVGAHGVTNREACEWVHRQLIVDELDVGQLVAAFTTLAKHAPDSMDRRQGLFRTCCEIVLTSVPPAPPSDQAPPSAFRGRRVPDVVPAKL